MVPPYAAIGFRVGLEPIATDLIVDQISAPMNAEVPDWMREKTLFRNNPLCY